MLFYFFREYTKIPLFPRSRESERVRTETYIPSFPRISRHSHESGNPARSVSLVLSFG